MNTRIATILLLALLAGACGRDRTADDRGRPSLSWYRSLDDARAAAAETGDLILVSFEAPWCPWSKLMQDSVYVNPAVVESLATAKCVVVKAGADSALEKELGVVVYPTVLVTDAYGGELGRMIGYHSPREFLARLDAVRHSRENLADMFRREEAYSDDPAFLMSFGRMLLEMGLYDGALLRFDRTTRLEEEIDPSTMEEAEYSVAECYMLSGKYKEAGRRFRIFTETFPDGERRETAMVLAAVCYQKAGYVKVATDVYHEYLAAYDKGEFTSFVKATLESLNRGKSDAG